MASPFWEEITFSKVAALDLLATLEGGRRHLQAQVVWTTLLLAVSDQELDVWMKLLR